MFRASTILNNARLEKDLDLSEISKKLKIPLKYLEAFESEDISAFPSEPYCSLIIKDYADFLGLNGQEILSVFRRDFEQKRKIKSRSKIFLTFTPQSTFVLTIIISLFLFSVYLISEYLKFNRPPKLKINWPAESVSVNNNIEISGTTDPESTVSVNGDLVIVNSEGKFQKKLSFATSEAKIRIESKSPSGKITSEEKVLK